MSAMLPIPWLLDIVTGFLTQQSQCPVRDIAIEDVQYCYHVRNWQLYNKWKDASRYSLIRRYVCCIKVLGQ